MISPFRKNKSLFWVSGLVILLIAGRVSLPIFILNHLNNYLENFSPLYGVHIEDVDLHLFRMAYSFDHTKGYLKKPIKGSGSIFMIEKLEVSLAWRELLKGRFVADVVLVKTNLKVTTATLNALAGVGIHQAREDAKKVKDKTIPFDLEFLIGKDSQFEFSDLEGLPPEQSLVLTHIELFASNLTPKKENELSLFTASGYVQNKANMSVVGELRSNKKPAEWSMNIELKDLKLSTLNPIARRMVPLTFKRGDLTFYMAAQSVQGNLQGYVKPFLRDVRLIGDQSDFKNIPHFFYEIIGTIGNFFLKNSKTQALATRINFKSQKGGKVETNTSHALSVAIKNAFGKALNASFDETLSLDGMPKSFMASMEAKQAAAQLGTPYVSEISFDQNRAALREEEKEKITKMIHSVQSVTTVSSVKLLIWSDQTQSTYGQIVNPVDIQLAFERGRILEDFLRVHLKVKTEIMNMAKTPSRMDHFLRNQDFRIRESLKESISTKPEVSKAVLILFGNDRA